MSGDRAAEFGRAFVRTPRPNPPVVAWRWRYELSAIATLALMTVRVGALWTVVAALAAAAAFALVPPLRWRLWCVVTQHRVRTGLTQTWCSPVPAASRWCCGPGRCTRASSCCSCSGRG